MVLTFNVGNSTVPVVKAFYELTLNGIGAFQAAFASATLNLQGEADTTQTVEIYRDGVLELKGEVEQAQTFEGGSMVISGFGLEKEFVDTPAPVTSGKRHKTYTSTDDDTIFADLVSNVSGWSSDVTGSTATSVDAFRVSESQSTWSAIIDLVKQTGKELSVNYSTKTLNLLDSKGNSSSFSFSEGRDITDLTRTKRKPKASKVIVYGKGDGENQIVGDSGTGTPVHIVHDSNILTETAADQRASKELALLQNSIFDYSFKPQNSTLDIETGDTGDLTSGSFGLSSQTLAVVRVKRKVDSRGQEFLELEVTDTNHRQAKKNLQEEIAESRTAQLVAEQSMQGAGNVQTWGTGINAKSGAPAKIGFLVSDTLMQDEAGNLRINSLTVDYDVDPYNQQYGDASFTGADPQVQNTSGNDAPDVANDSGSTGPSVTGTSSTTAIFQSEGSTSGSSTLSSGFNNQLLSLSVGSGSYEYLIIEYSVSTNFSPAGIVHLSVEFDPLGTRRSRHGWLNASKNEIEDCIWIPIHGSVNGTETMDIYTDTGGSYNYSMTVYGFNLTHSHGDGSYAALGHTHADGTYAAASHGHPDGSYDINAADIDSLDIGDDVSEAASVNATSVDIYLDHWNGTSWVNKHSVLATGNTIDTDVDITDSGTYPDATGFWRVRIEPNNATADFVQGIVKLKHHMDN